MKDAFWSLVSINQSLYVLGNYALELSYAFKEHSIAKKLNNPLMIAYSNGQLCDSYWTLGEYDVALKYWRESVKIAEQFYPEERPAVYGLSSRLFEKMQNDDSALSMQKKATHLLNTETTSLSKVAYSPLWEPLSPERVFMILHCFIFV